MTDYRYVATCLSYLLGFILDVVGCVSSRCMLGRLCDSDLTWTIFVN